ncbi:MAG: RNA repair transcriptional activator RtcR family protein [Solidesulfovibrio sp.]|uniref:sigma-54 interaction domain-containing protein n=1 Tax=Solidesulfovibrio sp. TaxID=2910990 RepID=UPI00315912EC
MGTILLSWVGHTDRKILKAHASDPEYPGPIGRAIKACNPDKTVLLFDLKPDQGDQDCDDFKAILPAAWRNRVKVRPVRLADPTDYTAIYEASRQALSCCAQEEPDAKFLVHISSGSPAMHAVWIILAKTEYPAKLIQTSREKEVQEIDIPFGLSLRALPGFLSLSDDRLGAIRASLPKTAAFDGIVGESKILEEQKILAKRIAMISEPVLILGQSGTGKELFARAIHQASNRNEGPFVPVNCGAIPESLIESELFGHEKGAFTGATEKFDGKFAQADGGVIFLDEIGEMPLAMQVRLLRVLQEKKYCRVGGRKELSANCRIIAATNREILTEVVAGRFREDLYYRLAQLILRLPSLDERGLQDKRLLIRYILKNLNDSANTKWQFYKEKQLDADAMKLVLNTFFPGNVRQLEHIVTRAALLYSPLEARIIDAEAISCAISDDWHDNAAIRAWPELGGGIDLDGMLRDCEAHYLKKAIERTQGNLTQAAKLLGLTRQTFSSRLKNYAELKHRVDASPKPNPKPGQPGNTVPKK